MSSFWSKRNNSNLCLSFFFNFPLFHFTQPIRWCRLAANVSSTVLQRNLLLLTANDVPATKSIVQLPLPEAESIVKFFLATMYGGQETIYTMNGNSIETPMIPGSTGISPSPTILQQQQLQLQHQQHTGSELYSNGNAIASLRTHSSKFPVSTIRNHKEKKSSLAKGLVSPHASESKEKESTLLCEPVVNVVRWITERKSHHSADLNFNVSYMKMRVSRATTGKKEKSNKISEEFRSLLVSLFFCTTESGRRNICCEMWNVFHCVTQNERKSMFSLSKTIISYSCFAYTTAWERQR